MGSVNEGAMEAVAINLSSQKAPHRLGNLPGHDGVSCMRNGLRARYGASPMVSPSATGSLVTLESIRNHQRGKCRVNFCRNVGK